MSTSAPAVPSLDELGRDLLRVAPWRKFLSLAVPFVFVALFFVLAQQGQWIAAAVCTSMHAYRVAHLHHHAHYPAKDDIEGAASKMTFLSSLIDGLTLQPRLVLFALWKKGSPRVWILGECTLAAVAFAAAVLVFPEDPARLDPFFERAGLQPTKLFF